jgi:para-nitrobenzyl esterase
LLAPALSRGASTPLQSCPARPVISASASIGIVETNSGKVQGSDEQGIYCYKGIPYGRTTAGDGRFMPPLPPTPWPGIRSSLYYGYVCPQEPREAWSNDELAFVFEWEDGIPSEDCLRLNVWTPAADGRGKRPVMVWLHGGAFAAGCSQEHKGYDGANLSRRGQVVVVSLNHRLGALGHLNLAEVGGERFAASGNAGMLDIVAALQWVRANIDRFGGDPQNVTIFGQSGGAGKVTTLMGMPSAAGLFHRAIAQSPSMVSPQPSEQTANSRLQCSRNLVCRLHTSKNSNSFLMRKLSLPGRRWRAGVLACSPGRPPSMGKFCPNYRLGQTRRLCPLTFRSS